MESAPQTLFDTVCKQFKVNCTVSNKKTKKNKKTFFTFCDAHVETEY